MVYGITFAISLFFTLVYVIIWHKHFDVHLTFIFTFIPISELGLFLTGISQTMEEAIVCLKITYLGSCYLILFITLSIFNLCKINVKKWILALMFICTTVAYAGSLTIGYFPFFYKDVSFDRINGYSILTDKVYGIGHTLFYCFIILALALGIGVIIYSYIRKRNISRKLLSMLLMPEILTVLGYFYAKIIPGNFELISITYVVAQFVYILIVYRVCLYNIDDSVMDSLIQTGDTAYISIDFRMRYLGCNETARVIFPDINQLAIDQPVYEFPELNATLTKWVHEFNKHKEMTQFYHESGEKIYNVTVRSLYAGGIKSGYQFFFSDDTQNQNYIKLLDKYSSELEIEVEKKTNNLVEMHNKLILGMAAMVESRDNSTGGHIMRTSEGVRLLVDEILKDGTLQLSDKFCKDIIKAAPMHDLGKVAVDDVILRKPGRFTPEEYEIMKTHAAEGAKIVHKILEGTEDYEFHILAENVAHYHHERWDGSGCPDGLKGEEIPLEARIMAIADVYDALVSKRVYKEKMSFEEANSIIMDSFGKHFDENLKKYYVAARPKLEAYYTEHES